MKTLTNIPVAVHRGAFQNDAANAFVSAIAPEFESSDNQQDSNFGVDSHEITEYHLQAALSSTQVVTLVMRRQKNTTSPPRKVWKSCRKRSIMSNIRRMCILTL